MEKSELTDKIIKIIRASQPKVKINLASSERGTGYVQVNNLEIPIQMSSPTTSFKTLS